MTVRHTVLCICAATTLLGGCVTQEKHMDLEVAYRKNQEQVVQLQNQNQDLRSRLDALERDNLAYSTKVSELSQERESLQTRLDTRPTPAAPAAPSGSGGNRLAITQVSPELDTQLQEFANLYPELVTYEQQLGMIKFRSDLTFALGRTDVNVKAKASLARLAGVLRSSAAAQYEVLVVGHTDNVPITKAETLAKHPNNWYLSAHRALSVRRILEISGVPAIRMAVMGYGMYRPVARNTSLGSASNRRVEIYLLNMRGNLPNEEFINARPAVRSSSAPAPIREQPAAPAAPFAQPTTGITPLSPSEVPAPIIEITAPPAGTDLSEPPTAAPTNLGIGGFRVLDNEPGSLNK